MSSMNEKISIDSVTICFSGDSGDGMQLTGSLFSSVSASEGNSISTFPDFPAEIRAPRGTVSGVSGFQINIGQEEVHTPGDRYDVLVVMNPAALKANVSHLRKGGTIIIDIDSFDKAGIEKAGYTGDPFEIEKLHQFHVIEAPIQTLTQKGLEQSGLDNKTILRCKNMFALGLTLWLFDKSLPRTEEFIKQKFAKKKDLAEANIQSLNDGFNYGTNIQAQTARFVIPESKMEKGRYRNINGNTAVAWGLIAAAEKATCKLFLGSYPITPATEILQELAKRKDLGVRVFQAEDEIAGVCSAIGASFAGSLGCTSTSGPGLALKGEGIGLAVMAELPLVVVNVQRGGPSTGLPTKTEQSDLMQALYGRNGESPVVVIAASTPSNCFDYAYMAAKIAIEHMTPVILLTDGFLANGSQVWKIPALKDCISITIPTVEDKQTWTPYTRNAEKLARAWVSPGMPDLMHRIGGLEKDAATGDISYEGENHQQMVLIRDEKVRRVAKSIPSLQIEGDASATLLVVGWGGTYGHLLSAVKSLCTESKKVALAHFNYIHPLPTNTEEIFKCYTKILVCELNLGQFANHLRMEYPQFTYVQYNKVKGLPFEENELKEILLKNI